MKLSKTFKNNVSSIIEEIIKDCENLEFKIENSKGKSKVNGKSNSKYFLIYTYINKVYFVVFKIRISDHHKPKNYLNFFDDVDLDYTILDNIENDLILHLKKCLPEIIKFFNENNKNDVKGFQNYFNKFRMNFRKEFNKKIRSVFKKIKNRDLEVN